FECRGAGPFIFGSGFPLPLDCPAAGSGAHIARMIARLKRYFVTIVLLASAPRSGGRKLARRTRFLRTPGTAPIRLLRILKGCEDSSHPCRGARLLIFPRPGVRTKRVLLANFLPPLRGDNYRIQEVIRRAMVNIQAEQPMIMKQGSIRVVAFASLIGTTIEWYDFFLYGTAAALVLNQLFFPTFDPFAGTLAALMTYAVGFVARPI